MVYKAVMFYGGAPLRTVRSFVRADDVTAMLAARSLLEHSLTAFAVELWQGKRRIGKLYRPAGVRRIRCPGPA